MDITDQGQVNKIILDYNHNISLLPYTAVDKAEEIEHIFFRLMLKELEI